MPAVDDLDHVRAPVRAPSTYAPARSRHTMVVPECAVSHSAKESAVLSVRDVDGTVGGHVDQDGPVPVPCAAVVPRCGQLARTCLSPSCSSSVALSGWCSIPEVMFRTFGIFSAAGGAAPI